MPWCWLARIHLARTLSSSHFLRFDYKWGLAQVIAGEQQICVWLLAPFYVRNRRAALQHLSFGSSRINVKVLWKDKVYAVLKHGNWICVDQIPCKGCLSLSVEKWSQRMIPHLLRYATSIHDHEIIIWWAHQPWSNEWFSANRFLIFPDTFTVCHHLTYVEEKSYQFCSCHINGSHILLRFPRWTKACSRHWYSSVNLPWKRKFATYSKVFQGQFQFQYFTQQTPKQKNFAWLKQKYNKIFDLHVLLHEKRQVKFLTISNDHLEFILFRKILAFNVFGKKFKANFFDFSTRQMVVLKGGKWRWFINWRRWTLNWEWFCLYTRVRCTSLSDV